MPEQPIRVGVVFGGPSAESDVSAASALSVVRGLRPDRYTPVVIGVTKDGRWVLVPPETVREHVARESSGPAINDRFVVEGTEVELRRGGRLISPDAPDAPLAQIDVVFPAMHGPYGEDGVLQGFLEALDVPYAGCGVLASSVSMDKVAMRRAFAAEGVPVTPGVWFTERRWRDHDDPATLVGDLRWPLFVKPSNMGSSIGIARVTDAGELARAVEDAFRYDEVVLVEQGITARELQVAVLGDSEEPAASMPSEFKSGGWSDYEQKYLSTADVTTCPAELPPAITERVRELSLLAFHSVGGYGLARVDFFYDEGAQELYVGEINTMPGFTARSLYARAWAASGVSYEEILVRLLDLAFARYERKSRRATA
jgi:D-alanine-D-alanine ligase